jgi:hypothetical protein
VILRLVGVFWGERETSGYDLTLPSWDSSGKLEIASCIFFFFINDMEFDLLHYSIPVWRILSPSPIISCPGAGLRVCIM